MPNFNMYRLIIFIILSSITLFSCISSKPDTNVNIENHQLLSNNFFILDEIAIALYNQAWTGMSSLEIKSIDSRSVNFQVSHHKDLWLPCLRCKKKLPKIT
jgi:uncharacterized metal-binding protein YceD (DUF177 family)